MAGGVDGEDDQQVGIQVAALGEYGRIKWERAQDLRRQGRLDEAAAELLEALAEEPEALLLKASLASIYVRQGRLLEAGGLVEEITAVDPGFTAALVLRGEIAFRQRNFEQAEHHYASAYQADSRPYLALRWARTLRKMQRYREALEVVDSCLVRHPEQPGLLKEKAMVLNRMGREDQAVEIYEKLRVLDPGDRFVQKEILRLKARRRPQEQVIAELEKAAAMPSRREDPQLHGLLGQKLREAGRVEEAAAAYHTAATIDPDNLFYLKQEGFCHYRLGADERALACLVAAFRRDPADYHVRQTLEKIYTRNGCLHDYLALLQEVSRLHPDNRPLWGKIARLKKHLATADTQNRGESGPAAGDQEKADVSGREAAKD